MVAIAVAIACLWAADGRASTPPSPDPSTQILPDPAPGGAQTQTPQHSGPAPKTSGQVTPVAPPARSRPAPVHTAAPTSTPSGTIAAHTTAHRRAEARARKSAAKRAARHEPSERPSLPPVRRPLAFLRDQLTPPWNLGPATVSPSKRGSGPPLAALALVLLVVTGASLMRLSGTGVRGRPA
jgi:hypothetical protein